MLIKNKVWKKETFFLFFANVNVAIVWRQQKYAKKKQKQKVGTKSGFKQYTHKVHVRLTVKSDQVPNLIVIPQSAAMEIT